MSWYQRYVLPRLVDSVMRYGEFGRIRPSVLQNARGVVLEIGVGSGLNTPLYRSISKLYALEPSVELLALAKQKVATAPVEYLHAGAEHIPLPDHSVDTVVSTWTLCSVGNPKEVLNEIRRVLRPGGKFLFVDHGISPHLLTHVLQNTLTPLTKHFTGNCHYNRDIEGLIKEAGFNIQQMDHPHERFKPLIYNYQGIATF